MRRQTLIAISALCLALNVVAEEIQVGERTIEIPYPGGFIELTSNMSPYYESMNAYIAPTNTRYLTLIGEQAGETVSAGEFVELARYINIESENGIVASSVSAEDFAELRGIYRTQVDNLLATVEEQVPDMIEAGNAALSEEFSADIAVKLGGVATLPIHLDTESVIANSMYVIASGSVDGNDVGTQVVAATSLILHVKDKVLFLFVYGDEADMEWTRGTATAFAADITAANPLSAEEQEAVDNSGSPSIWSGVWEKALIGAVIGGLLGAFSMIFRRKKS